MSSRRATHLQAVSSTLHDTTDPHSRPSATRPAPGSTRADRAARDPARRHSRLAQRAAHHRARLRAYATIAPDITASRHPHGTHRPRTDARSHTAVARALTHARALATRCPRSAPPSAAADRPTTRPPHILIDLPEAGRPGGPPPTQRRRSTTANGVAAAVERRRWERATGERVCVSARCCSQAAHLSMHLDQNALREPRSVAELEGDRDQGP